MKKRLSFILLILIGALVPMNIYAEEVVYTNLRVIDNGTFNEYRYKITEKYFRLREIYEVDGIIDSGISEDILSLVEVGFDYLPSNNLKNINYYNNLVTALKRGIKYPNNEANFSLIKKGIGNFLDKVSIPSIKGSIQAYPTEGNAPMVVTFRSNNISDPTGTIIPEYNYEWWIKNDTGKKVIIGRKKSISYPFKEEGTFSVFLDVKSNHKNDLGNTDVLSFRSREDIKVNEKIASLIIKINSDNLRNRDEIKFSPEEARYGLLFDATSSTPTSGSKFIRTEWDFGNGVKKDYEGPPRVERIVYSTEGEFTVKLKLKTNELKTVERKFLVSVHNPIATIKSSADEGFLGDKFTFSAKPSGNNKNLSYDWEIVDINNDKIIEVKLGSLFTYEFKNKGKYNIKLNVKEPSGESDIDTKIIYINSRAPIADFKYSTPKKNEPNTILFDATKSYDLDYSDDGKLEYSWIIDGNRVNLEKPNSNGSYGYYTFDSVGEHSVTLEVVDPDNMSDTKQMKVDVKSILALDFAIYPRVIQREGKVKIVSDSPEAKFYEWDFGDGESKSGDYSEINHQYNKSGIFNINLKVRDSDGKLNQYTKVVYVGESDRPVSHINIKSKGDEDISYRKGECFGNGAYIGDKVTAITFSSEDSIDIDGKNKGLEYSWKLMDDKYFSSDKVNYKFDDIGCFPVKLTVKSSFNKMIDSETIWVKIENVVPTLSSLSVNITSPEDSDPVIVNVKALGSKDKDGVIQSYLWYYYTDIDNAPQDFRGTRNPETTFVIPRVTGNYYFVVVMKDNNEERSNSEEITGSKFYITLTGDNINTPLITLNVDNSSVSVLDEVNFYVDSKNILGQDIGAESLYSWDFDGDGFYDRETTSPEVSHKFSSSGEFHVKVKVKHKGFSNTKTLTINVANNLEPKFEYISIGNKIVFLNTSVGEFDTASWDLGDDTKEQKKGFFIHTYEDGKSSHMVDLKLTEGTKFKNTKVKVLKNVKNILKSRKKGLVLFSYPKIEEDKIILKDPSSKVFVYLGESSGEIAYYSIDYDIDYDTDLNGTRDDDDDNKQNSSYMSGGPDEIELNGNRLQTIRLVLKNELSEVIESKDIKIIKDYITDLEDQINLDDIVFEGIGDREKEIMDSIKKEVSDFPTEYRLKGMMYIQKLQEEWFDNTERTRVIIEFETFLEDTFSDTQVDYIKVIDLLESILILDNPGDSVELTALKNLLPLDIECEFSEEFQNCNSYLLSILETINNSKNIDENKVLGKQILVVVEETNTMSNQQKVDFKSILETLVYGDFSNIPKECDPSVEDCVGEEKPVEESSSIIATVMKYIGIIFIIFLGASALYFIYYKLTNKEEDNGFRDFIIDKTSDDSINDSLDNNIEKKDLEKPNIDILSGISSEKPIDKKQDFNPLSKASTISKNPIGNIDLDSDSEKVEKKESVPDWLKGGTNKKEDKATKLSIKDKVDKTPKPPAKDDVLKEDKKNKVDDLDEITKIEKDDGDIPDWLKGSFNEEKKEKKKEEKMPDSLSGKLKENTKKVEKEKNIENKDDGDIPDWLKGSFGEEKKEENKKEVKGEEKSKVTKEKKPNVKETKIEKTKEKIKKEEVKTKKVDKKPKVEAIKDKIDKKSKAKVTKKEEDKAKKIEKKSTEKKDIKENKDNTKGKKNELWDDGMNVPDWLQGGEEDTKKTV